MKKFDPNDYCQCDTVKTTYAEQTSDGYWLVCSNCGKRIYDTFTYFDQFIEEYYG